MGNGRRKGGGKWMEERVGILYFEASDAHTFETSSVSMSSHHPGCCQLTETTASRWCPQYILCACVCYGGDYVVHCCLRHDVHIWNTSKICLQSNFTANKKASFEEMAEKNGFAYVFPRFALFLWSFILAESFICVRDVAEWWK